MSEEPRKGMIHRAFSLILRVLVVILALEVLCFGILTGLDLMAGKSPARALKNRGREMITAWKRLVLSRHFDPLCQVRQVPGARYYGLEVNSHGFLGNGHTDSLLNTYPEKPDRLYRIILLGGSSVAGLGAVGNQETIPAFLESLLNKGARGGKAFQVLNFGSPGGYTATEAGLLLFELAHVQPDMVIAFDGYNDLWNALFEYKRIGLPHRADNWADFSYLNYLYLNGLLPERTRPLKIFTFTSMLLDRVTRKNQFREELLLANPHYRQSGMTEEKDPFGLSLTTQNLDAMASWCALKRLPMLCFLQPNAFNGKRVLSSPEQGRILDFFNTNTNRKGITTFEEYGRKMSEGFSLLEGVYQSLGRKYGPFGHIRFISLADAFSDVTADTYVDDCHLAGMGNLVIAKKMLPHVQALLPGGPLTVPRMTTPGIGSRPGGQRPPGAGAAP